MLWKNDLDVFKKKFYNPFHWTSLYSSRVIRDTDPRMERAWVLTEAWGYYTVHGLRLLYSACQFGSLVPGPQVFGSLGPQVLGSRVPGSPGPRVPGPWSWGPLNIVSHCQGAVVVSFFCRSNFTLTWFRIGSMNILVSTTLHIEVFPSIGLALVSWGCRLFPVSIL